MKLYTVPAHFIHLPLAEQIAQGKNFWRAEESEHVWADGYTAEQAIAKLEEIKRRKGVIV
jgi:hypothetical protein